MFINDVAGNDGLGYEAHTKMLVHGRYESTTINGVEVTGLFDPHAAETLLTSGSPDTADCQANEGLFLRAAEWANTILHNGGVNENDRPRVMVALLLAPAETASLDLEGDLPVLIGGINNRTNSTLRRHGRREFHLSVRIEPSTNLDSHVEYKTAIVRTIRQLLDLNIKSAMSSGIDVLGKFYEAFLCYGNGAKEMGVVLAPRHITRLAVDTVGASPSDLVSDPACGTGSFLVMVFDYVRVKTGGAPLERFRRFGLFGIEQESSVVAPAIVSMIFRGDGKNNTVEADCFNRFLTRPINNGHATAQYVKVKPESGGGPITHVFVGPSFALEKLGEHE